MTAAFPQSVADAPSNPVNTEVVKSAIREISHIATLPEVTVRIIQLVEDPESTAHDLHQVITNDMALGSRILKVVNSAFYGLPGQIGSIDRAIVLLGLNAVKNIAIAASLAKLFRGGQLSPHFNARDLWTNAIAVGTGTRLLATRARLGLPDEAFLAGLIHDLGVMVEMQSSRAKFVDVIDRAAAEPNARLQSIEYEVFGATHEEFGTGLCAAWKFPKSFAYVTGYHHRPGRLAQATRRLACLVFTADVVAARMELGWTRGVQSHDLPAKLLEELQLSNEDVEAVMKELPEAIEEASALLRESP